jgi:hypothetical protein
VTSTAPDVRTARRVTYFEPGSFLSEETVRPIADGPDIVQRAAAGAPPRAFCFALSTVLVADSVPDGQGGTLTVLPKEIGRTGRYYLAGRLFDRDEVLALGGHDTLASNMRDQWPLVILTAQGNWQPFEDADVLLTAVPMPPGLVVLDQEAGR